MVVLSGRMTLGLKNTHGGGGGVLKGVRVLASFSGGGVGLRCVLFCLLVYCCPS